jgi:hypothetical protein
MLALGRERSPSNATTHFYSEGLQPFRLELSSLKTWTNWDGAAPARFRGIGARLDATTVKSRRDEARPEHAI